MQLYLSYDFLTLIHTTMLVIEPTATAKDNLSTFFALTKDMPSDKMRNFKSVKEHVKIVLKRINEYYDKREFLLALMDIEPLWADGIIYMLGKLKHN